MVCRGCFIFGGGYGGWLMEMFVEGGVEFAGWLD